jgi:hypothetical protein
MQPGVWSVVLLAASRLQLAAKLQAHAAHAVPTTTRDNNNFWSLGSRKLKVALLPIALVLYCTRAVYFTAVRLLNHREGFEHTVSSHLVPSEDI